MDIVAPKPKRTRKPKAPVKAPVPGHRKLAAWSILHRGASVQTLLIKVSGLNRDFLGKPVTT